MNLKKKYIESWRYLSGSRNYIFLALGIFILFGLFGTAFYSKLVFLDELLKQILDRTSGFNTFQLIIYIFMNNLMAALYGMLGGLFFGIYPMFNAILNGTMLGYVFAKVYEKVGAGEFWRIFPHGIFELPAVFIALGLGIKIGMFWFKKDMRKQFVYDVQNALWVFLLFVFPLIAVAAVIEGVLIGISK